MKRLEKEGAYAEVFKLKKTIETTPQIAKYLKSDRREKYSSGIFVSITLFFRRLGRLLT
jgi:glutathione S-transferase